MIREIFHTYWSGNATGPFKKPSESLAESIRQSRFRQTGQVLSRSSGRTGRAISFRQQRARSPERGKNLFSRLSLLSDSTSRSLWLGAIAAVHQQGLPFGLEVPRLCLPALLFGRRLSALRVWPSWAARRHASQVLGKLTAASAVASFGVHQPRRGQPMAPRSLYLDALAEGAHLVSTALRMARKIK